MQGLYQSVTSGTQPLFEDTCLHWTVWPAKPQCDKKIGTGCLRQPSGQLLHHVHLPTSPARPAKHSGNVHATAYVGALLPSAVLKEHVRLVERQLSAEHVPVAPRPQRQTPAQHHPHSAPASLVTVRKTPALTDPYPTAAVLCCCCCCCDMCDRGSS
jgi:hypothetical protein